MSKYLSSKCIRPLFLQKTKEDGGKCGNIDGFIYAFLFTVISAGVFIKFDIYKIKYAIYGYLLFLSILWISVPIITSFSYGNMWDGYQETITDLMSQGYTRQEALSFINGMNQPTSLAEGKISAMIFASKENEMKNMESKIEENKDVKDNESN